MEVLEMVLMTNKGFHALKIATEYFGESEPIGGSPKSLGDDPSSPKSTECTMETGYETQAPTRGITLESIIEVLNNMGGKLNVVRGDITRMGDRLVNMEGQVNFTNSTPQATFRASTSGHDHTNSPTITPRTLHQALDPTLMQLGSNSQSINKLFHFPLSKKALPNQNRPYQTPLNQNVPYQRLQPQLNPVNEVRNDENQEGYEGEGECHAPNSRDATGS
uniref:Uncharacterized protein n=1 Tax=Solanum tuberosum TaxID=4113 RepID=M1E0Y1_SOLTU